MSTKGFLIHAYNNMEIDYGSMALCAASLIKKNLKENHVTVVTSRDTLRWIEKNHTSEAINFAFDNIIVISKDEDVFNRKFYDTRYASKIQPYYNTARVSSYDLSPYEETILLDADYLVLDNSLDSVWGSVEELLMNKSVRDLTHKTDLRGFDSRFNSMSIPLYWATLLYFKKTNKAKTFFELTKFIKDNYDYYKHLYQFASSGYYRNDYAMSIAVHMINGQFENDSVKSFPCPTITIATEYDDMIDFKNGIAYFISEQEQGKFLLHKVMSNIHVMNKWSITRTSDRILTYASN